MSLYSLSILIGASGIPVMFYLAREFGLRHEAWLASLLWCIYPSILFYSRFIRPQNGVIVLCSIFLLLLLRCLKHPTVSKFTILAILGILGSFWSHLFLLFWLGVILASASLSKIRNATTRGYWFVTGTICVFHGITLLLCKYFHNTHYPKFTWLHVPSLKNILGVFIEILAPISKQELGYLWILPILTFLSVLINVGWIYFFQHDRYSTSSDAQALNEKDLWKFLLVSTLCALGVLFLITYTKQPLVLPRFLVYIIPAALLVLVKGISLISKQENVTRNFCLPIFLVFINSWHMIHNRNYGLIDCMTKLEQLYDAKNDIVFVLPGPGREALKLYCHDSMNGFTLNRRICENKESWTKELHLHVAESHKLWFLTLRKKRIIQPQKLEELGLSKFYSFKSGKTNLTGFYLLKHNESKT